jgi:hypothetical protein
MDVWLTQTGAEVAVALSSDGVTGVGMTRQCVDGVKIGPVSADDPETARRIIRHLVAGVGPGRTQIDIPEPNTTGLAIATELGMTASFGFARIYHGPDPALPLEGIFGITSFEFG